MTYLENQRDGEITAAECIVNGVDILQDVMGGLGFEMTPYGGSFAVVVQNSNEVDWWLHWARNEELISQAYGDATDEQRRACEVAISDWGHDLQALQEVQAQILGIELEY